jgi:hypothetical protein
MAWDSTQTASMISGYQGMYSQQMGYAQQLSGFGYNPYAGNSGVMANNMTLGAMRGVGTAANFGMTALGVGAGMGVMAAGGGMLAATGVGLPIAAAGAAMGYAGHHMYEGASQQAALNQTLRGSFGFRNSQGGHGFNTADMAGIGGALRDMSHQFGSGGEITSFRELSSLAGKMGQMGFAQGVRDVQTFTKKFKEMTDALKTMAKDLGTTLEGAMEFAQQAKQSGVFGMGKTAAFTSMARQTAVSGGLAMSEVTAMAGIGSQISRSIGGLGSQGAIGGMRTIGQIGTATQMGVLSEEDIYNATGLTGAEGRQAFAAGNMSRTANFLKSGRGRRMISSMADRDGNLDQNALDQFMSGGMGVEETMGSWSGRKDKIGRANFIRNEGRLRGQVLEKIGGFGDAMQMMQWARSKGVDINNMDDRSMLFAQRQLGMGRDEADAAIKMAQNMPSILAQQNADASNDKLFQRLAQNRKTQGIEGIKNRFAQAQETVNGALEKAGQQIFNDTSSKIEGFLNKLAGVYVESSVQDIDRITRDIRGGGMKGAEARRQFLGQGRGAVNLKGVGMPDIGGGGGSLEESLRRGSDGDFASSLKADLKSSIGFYNGQTAKFLFQGQSGMSRAKASGYDLSGMGDSALSRKFSEIEAAKTAASKFDPTLDITEQSRKAISSAYAMGALDKTSGDVRMKKFEEAVLPNLSESEKARYKQAKTSVEKAQIIGNWEARSGISGPHSLANNIGLSSDITDRVARGFRSDQERQEFLGGLVGGGKQEMTMGEKVKAGVLTGLVNTATFGLGGFFLDKRIKNHVTGGRTDKTEEMGRIAESSQYISATAGLFSSDKTIREKGRAGLEGRLNSEKMSEVERGMYQDLMKFGSYDQLSGEARAAEAKKMGMSVEDADKRVLGIKQNYAFHQKKAQEEFTKREKQFHQDTFDRLQSKGVVGADGKLRKLSDKETASLGPGGAAFLEKVIAAEKRGGETGEFDYDQFDGDLEKMTVAQRRAVASKLGGTLTGAKASTMNVVASRMQKGKRLGEGGGLAYALGMDARSAKGLGSINFDNVDDLKRLAGEVGLDASKVTKDSDLAKLLRSAGKGSVGATADLKQQVDSAKAEEEKKKKQQSAEDDPNYQLMKKVEKHLEGMAKDTKSLPTISEGIWKQVQTEVNK